MSSLCSPPPVSHYVDVGSVVSESESVNVADCGKSISSINLYKYDCEEKKELLKQTTRATRKISFAPKFFVVQYFTFKGIV